MKDLEKLSELLTSALFSLDTFIDGSLMNIDILKMMEL